MTYNEPADGRGNQIADGHCFQIQQEALRGDLADIGTENTLHGNLHLLVLHVHQHLTPNAHQRQQYGQQGEQPHSQAKPLLAAIQILADGIVEHDLERQCRIHLGKDGLNLLYSSQTFCAPGQPDIRKRHRKEILSNHLEAYRPVWLPHGSDVHIVHETHNWRSFAEFFRIDPCLNAVFFQVLGKEDGTEIVFAEAAPFHDFQAQYLREVPAAVDHAHHHR